MLVCASNGALYLNVSTVFLPERIAYKFEILLLLRKQWSPPQTSLNNIQLNMICSCEFDSSRDQNNRFSNARQNVRYYQILTRHFKNPSDIISACLGSRVQAPPTCLSAKMYYDNFWHASIFLL